MFEWFLLKCLIGTPSFIGWFISYYFCEMVLVWLPIVAKNPEWAVPAAQILQIPAALLALRKAKKRVDKWERFH